MDDITNPRLKAAPQFNRYHGHWLTIDEAEMKSLVSFMGTKDGQDWITSGQTFRATSDEPGDDAHVVFIGVPIVSFPMEKYLSFRLKQFEAEANLSEVMTIIGRAHLNGRFEPRSKGPQVFMPSQGPRTFGAKSVPRCEF